MVALLQIPIGDFNIGNESIPNAGPSHVRQIRQLSWIDTFPLTWRHYEVFVAGGGYHDRIYWPQSFDLDQVIPTSVDSRIKELLLLYEELSGRIREPVLSSSQCPIAGLNWPEAYALASFYGARLPTEFEWEIMTVGKKCGPNLKSFDMKNSDSSAVGADRCTIISGMLEEWTSSRFTPKYWLADRNVSIENITPKMMVTIRGGSPTSVYQHPCFRIGRDPLENSMWCGLRRVWDKEPQLDQIEPSWR